MAVAIEYLEQRRLERLDSPLARANSSYAAYRDGRLQRAVGLEQPMSPLAEMIHDAFRALAPAPGLPCCTPALPAEGYRFGLYCELAVPAATAGLAYDLNIFVREQWRQRHELSRFVASFIGPHITDDVQFQRLLRAQLRHLRDADGGHDSPVAYDPATATVSVRVAGRAFSVATLHPMSRRPAQRFAWPTLIFTTRERPA